MSKIKLTFLGTGTSQGIPMIACQCEVCQSDDAKDIRLRTSVKIEVNGLCFIVDTGPDFRTQMLQSQTNYIDAILFTHQHKDHTAGLDDVRAYNYFQKEAMPVYASSAVCNTLRNEFAYIFEEHKYPGIPDIKLHEIDHNIINIYDILIQPLPCLHGKMPVFGFKIGGLAYITDANFIYEDTLDLLTNIDVLVLNALRHEKHISHFSLSEAIEISNKINAKHTFFTHISHQLGTHHMVSKTLPNNKYLAYDGLQVYI